MSANSNLTQRIQSLVGIKTALLEELVKHKELVFFTLLAIRALINESLIPIVWPNERFLLTTS
jgi:hypothetical protein